MNMCDCPLPELVNPPPPLVASDYIRLKKDRLLYGRYANPSITVCTFQPRYTSYELKQSMERGCFYDQVYCQYLYPKLTCKYDFPPTPSSFNL
jgi:hypothetical protein